MLDEIQQVIEWYQREGSTTTIERLLDCQDYLATVSFTLCELVSSAKKDYLDTETNKKAELIQKELQYKETLKATEAKQKAFLDTLEIQRIEDTQKAYFALVDLKRQQLNRVIEAIKQRVSHMKKEKELSNQLRNIENK